MTQAPEKTTFHSFEVRPNLLAKGKTTARLATTDIMTVGVQVVAGGGETNLHAHANEDATWLVLNGRVRFYTTGDEVVGEYGRYEGVVIPRGVPYWFESASEENLVVVRIAAKDRNAEHKRLDFSERKFAVTEADGRVRGKRPTEMLDVRFGD